MKNSTKTFAISIIILLATLINVNAQDNLMAFNNTGGTEYTTENTEENLSNDQKVEEEIVEKSEMKNINNYSLMNSVPADFKGSSTMIQQNQPKVNSQNLSFGNGKMNQNISKSEYGVGVNLRLK